MTAGGRSVDVGAGQQSIVRAGAVPTAAAPIPPSLFLKVGAARAGRAPEAAVNGETTPGVVVSINGARSAVDVRGRFTGTVPLGQGPNVIVVMVEDATGRRETKVINRIVDQRGPGVSTKVTW